MNSIRINITLPKRLVKRIRKEVTQGKTSSFIADAVKNKLDKIKKEKLNKLLEEGYKNRSKEDLEITKCYDITLEDGLDD